MTANAYYQEVVAGEKMAEIEGHANEQRLLTAASRGRQPLGERIPQLYLLVPAALLVAVLLI